MIRVTFRLGLLKTLHMLPSMFCFVFFPIHQLNTEVLESLEDGEDTALCDLQLVIPGPQITV